MRNKAERKKMRKIFSMIVPIILIILFSLLFTGLFIELSPALAEEKLEGKADGKSEGEAILLPEIVVTATRNQEKTARIPSHVTVITAEDIRNTSAQTVPDILRGEAGIHVEDYTGSGRTATVDLRGFGETGPLNSAVLVDGRRVDEIDQSGVDWSQIPLDRIERIEIIHGCGSVLYGDRAVGGVINIITKRGEGKPSLLLEERYGSYHNRKGTLEASGASGPLGYYLDTSFQDLDGYRQNSAFRNEAVGLRLSYTLSDNLFFDLTAGSKEDKYGLPGALTESDMASVRRTDSKTPQNWASTDEQYLHFTPQCDFEKFGSLKVPVSYRERKPYSDMVSWGLIMDNTIKRLGILPQYTLDMDFAHRKSTLTLGLDRYEDRLDDDISNLKIERNTTGYYAFDTADIIPDVLLATFGYRHEQASYSFKTPGSDTSADHDEDAVQAGLTMPYAKNSKVFFSYGQAFRLPATDEYYSIWATPRLNQSLTPQKTIQYDLGIQHSFDDDRLSLGVTLFTIDTSEEIFYNPLTFANVNYPKTRRYGSEVNFKAPLGQKISLSGSYAYLDSKLNSGDYKDKKIPGVARNKAHLSAHAEIWRFFSLDVQGQMTGSQFAIADWNNEAVKQESYTTVDTLLRFAWKGLNAWAGVNNLFSEEYSEYAVYAGGNTYYYPSPERNYTMGVSYKVEF